jgi:DnaJ-class molecular chaperone
MSKQHAGSTFAKLLRKLLRLIRQGTPCPACRGTGGTATMPCRECGGTGWL